MVLPLAATVGGAVAPAHGPALLQGPPGGRQSWHSMSPGPGIPDRHRRLGVHSSGGVLRPPGRSPVRHGLRRPLGIGRVPLSVLTGTGRARGHQWRRLRGGLHCPRHRAGCRLHLLSRGPHPGQRLPGQRLQLRPLPLRREAVQPRHLGRGLPHRQRQLRRRLELPIDGHPGGRQHDDPGAGLRPAGNPHRFPRQEAAAHTERPADHHAALRHRSCHHPAVRRVGNGDAGHRKPSPG